MFLSQTLMLFLVLLLVAQAFAIYKLYKSEMKLIELDRCFWDQLNQLYIDWLEGNNA